MKRTIILVFLALPLLAILVAGCGSAMTPVPTPTNVNPAEIAMTMLGQKVDAEATQMAVNVQFTATAQVLGATATQQAIYLQVTSTEQARRDAVATDQQQRRDAEATAQEKRNEAATEQARRDAEATAQQYQQNVIGTATGQMIATWNAATLEVLPTHAQWTQQAVAVEQTLAANNAELSNLNVKQQTQKNTAEWVVPLLVVLVIVIVFAVVQIRRSRVQKIENQEDGTVEGLLIDGETLIRPQLMPGPVLDLSGESVTAPQVTDKETQNEVTRRAQAIEALRAMPTQAPNANATLMTNSVFGEARKPVVEVLPPGSASRVILDELSDQVVEEE